MEKGLSNLDQSIQIGRCDYSTATSHKRAPALGDCCLASWAFAEALRDAIFLAGNSDGRSGLKAKPRLAALTEDRVSWVLHAEEFWPSKEAFEEQWARCPKVLRSLGRDNFRSEVKCFKIYTCKRRNAFPCCFIRAKCV